MTCCIEPVVERKMLSPPRLFLHARSATVLTGLLCKLQSEADLGLVAYSLEEVVKKES